jgi:hypothetical protein
MLADSDEFLDDAQAGIASSAHENGPLNDETPRLVTRLLLGEKLAQPTNRGARESDD